MVNSNSQDTQQGSRTVRMDFLDAIKDNYYVKWAVRNSSQGRVSGEMMFHHHEQRGKKQYVYQVVGFREPKEYDTGRDYHGHAILETRIFEMDGTPVEDSSKLSTSGREIIGKGKYANELLWSEKVPTTLTMREFLELERAPPSFKPKTISTLPDNSKTE